MKPVLLSSGDLIADRRADYAEMLLQSGEAGAAADLMRQAMELAPGWTAGWFRLGEMHEAAGMADPAAVAYGRAVELDPQDALGASLKLALVRQTPIPPAPPSAYVELLFDQYAREFDTALVERLDYRVPDLLGEVLSGIHNIGVAVDLGCGTGLMGPILRPRCSRLVGMDISAGMLRLAEERGVYDELIKADITVDPVPPADLVVAADVLMYVGALDRVFPAVAAALTPGGHFAFSVEAGDSDFLVLQDSRRFAHGRNYVQAMLSAAGLSLVALERHPIRLDRGLPIEGFVVLAAKTA